MVMILIESCQALNMSCFIHDIFSNISATKMIWKETKTSKIFIRQGLIFLMWNWLVRSSSLSFYPYIFTFAAAAAAQ